jgi:hypothetical protein
MPDWVWDRVATAACFVPLLAYVGLFLVRKEVSLPPWRVLALMSAGVGGRLVLLAAGFALDGATLVLSVLVGVILLALAVSGGRPFFIHSPEGAVRAEVEEACRRLFIQKEEPRPGEVRLTAKGTTAVLWLMPQGRSSAVIFLPRTKGDGKLRLFFDWLAKRYPGPIPRIRVDLTGGK